MNNKRTWLWVIAGIFGTLFLLFVLFVGSAVYMFRTHVHNENNVETVTAEREFETQLARFRGQQPLLEFTGDDGDDRSDRPTIHRPPPGAPRVRINTLRVLIYDRAQEHLIHADIPGWLLRSMPEGRARFFGGDDEFVRNRITIEDLERHGLGLICDGHNRNTRILIWAE